MSDPTTQPTPPVPEESETPLGSRVRSGLGWSVVNTVASRLANFVAGVVLARILTPEDYGTYAVALVVLTALLSMNELGVSLAIVRWPGDVGRIAPTVATLAMLTSLVLYAATLIAAPALARLVHAPAAVPMIRTLALVVLVDGLVAVPAAFITREFLQRRRLLIDGLGFLAGTSASIVLAVQGFGAWSLVWGFVVTSLVVGVATLVLAPVRLRFGWRRSEVPALLRFGLPLAAASAIVFLLMNLDYLVVGNALGATELGFYLIAFTMSSWVVNLISAAFRRVALAAFSRAAERPAGVGPAFVRSAGMLVLVTVPVCVGMAALAGPLVTTVYGAKWAHSAPALAALCGLAAARVVLELVYDLLAATGRSGRNLVLQSVWLALLVPALVAGARVGGIAGVALAHATVSLVVLLAVAGPLLHRVGVPVREALAVMVRPVVGGAAIVAAVWAALHLLTLPPPAALAVGTLIGGTAYLAVVWPRVVAMRAYLAS